MIGQINILAQGSGRTIKQGNIDPMTPKTVKGQKMLDGKTSYIGVRWTKVG